MRDKGVIKVATKSMLIYASTKGALASLTIVLPSLLAPRGIRINCVAPGPIWTPIQPIAKCPPTCFSPPEEVT